MKRIFVQIVSYRDPECHHTLAYMFKQATYPERIHVGLCWQFDPKADAEFVAIPLPRPEQVRVIQFHAKDAKGAGWARMQAQTLWAGEEYILQIQAHMRFEPGWDETLITLLEGLPSDKAVLTAWLPTYIPPERKEVLNGKLPVTVINRFGDEDDAQIVHMSRRSVSQEEIKAPFPTGLWVGNFLFCRAQVMQDVPFDPYIYFWGEELNFSARLWTHGYDIYHLDRAVLYHYWDRKEARDAKQYRDHQSDWNRRSLKRNLHVLGIRQTDDPAALEGLEQYGLGNERSITDYFAWIGVDMKRRLINASARQGNVTATEHPTIFVAIASYRDPELQPTVNDLFAKAAYPERVHVGICQQLHPSHDSDCVFVPPSGRKVRMVLVDAQDSKGANWARVQALSLREDETYILQIDSHMRFMPGWDEILIEMLARCPSEQPVISAYLPNYTPPDQCDKSPGHVLRLAVRRLGDETDPQLVHLTGLFVPMSITQGKLYHSPFIAANFLFGPAQVWKQVAVDPHIYFHGDEINMAARLWTHGVDVFQLDCVVAYHYWARQDQLKKHPYRKLRQEPAQLSRERNQHLLGIKKTANNAALADIEAYGLGSQRDLVDFWKFAGVDLARGYVSPAATKGLWNEVETDSMTSSSNRPRIFVQIASYRDPDCQRTVKDLFDKAMYPERIFVGICWQFVKEEDAICFEIPYPYPDQVRVHEVDARQGRGVCWARALTQKLWQGEEFTLQIDSHMRFESGWDETLLHMYEQCENPKAVLTCYPSGFEPPTTLRRDFFFGMSAKEFDEYGILKMVGKPGYRPNEKPARPMKNAFASACMMFGPSSIIADVPYDPHLYFFGEEITLAVRLWTHGYDLYQPNDFVIYHDWDRGKRPTHFKDHANTWWDLNLLSLARVRHLVGTEISHKPEILADLDQYGLGSERTLEQYQRFSGIDFARKTMNAHAMDWKNKDEIFVRIASYRDSECQWTVKDLFEKATHPERIKVAICWQFDEKEDGHCFAITTRPEQVQVIPVDWRDSEGVCWARAQTELLLENETYTLQIDSHMRFEPGWDELLIEELAACGSAKAVISCSPAKYTPPDHLDADKRPTVRRVLPFTKNGNLRGRGEYLSKEPEMPLRGAFVAAGFMFSRSDLLREVPYDPYLYFDQEEITYAMRLFTHGWNVYSARRQYLYHYYNDRTDDSRPLHWRDLEKIDAEKIRFFSARGLARFNHLSGYKQSQDSRTLENIEKYGLGNKRSLPEFEAFAGIDFKQKIAHPKAMQCGFIEHLERYRSSPIVVTQESEKTVKETYGVGDILPYFIAEDSNGKRRGIEGFVGKPMLLFFLPSQTTLHAEFMQAFHQALGKAGKMEAAMGLVVQMPPAQLAEFKQKHGVSYLLLADLQGAIAGTLGMEGLGGYLLAPNLQIKKRYGQLSPSILAQQAVDDVVKYIASHPKTQAVVSQSAPVLMIPEVFTPEFCAELLQAFKEGQTVQGEVGTKGVVPTAKLRTDYPLPTALRDKVDLKLSRSLFPEIEKIFGFKVAARENYKIGLYTGEENGFFARHRDNFEEGFAHRRVAMTLHLSDDYEGGGISFPEYDDRVYRPGIGGVVAFSCGMAHEAPKVTKGERFVLVGFFHGEEEEQYRQQHMQEKGDDTLSDEFVPLVQDVSGLEQSRDFYRLWKQQSKQMITPAIAAPVIQSGADMVIAPASGFTRTLAFAVGTARHQPLKVHESRGAVVFDNFLPQDMYDKLQNYCIGVDYERINTKGKVVRAWHLHDGFPLRSTLTAFHYADPGSVQNPKPHYAYPTGTEFDRFIEFMNEFQPQVEFYTGKAGSGWHHYSVTSWIYPPGTGLAMHDDGSGVYTGAYAFFVNKIWRPHWGGLLILMDDDANTNVHAHRATVDQNEFYRTKYLHANQGDELMIEHGLARCIFPKGNRMVFIANDAYHMVTRVNETAGDNVRLSLAGFFDRTKK